MATKPGFFVFCCRPPVERCKSAPKLGSIEESPELEEVEEKDWLRVLALRGSQSVQTLHRTNTVIKTVSPARTSLETVREEERCIPTPSLPCKIVAECDPSPDAVSHDGLLVCRHLFKDKRRHLSP